MTCPDCSSEQTATIEVKKTKTGSRRRRIECRACGHRWTTYDGQKPARHGAARWGHAPKPQEAQGGTCDACEHWLHARCSYGFPDPLIEGVGFAADCALYAACPRSHSISASCAA